MGSMSDPPGDNPEPDVVRTSVGWVKNLHSGKGL
jgi:hypothetical protein